MTQTTAATMGDNNPPADADPLRDRLSEDYAVLADRRDELLDAMDRVPENIEDEATAGKVSDFVNQLKAAAKNADKCRVDEKEVYLAGGRSVDGWFKAVSDPLLAAKKLIEKRLDVYLRKVAEEERQRRAEDERVAREAAEKAQREATEREAAMSDTGSLDDAIAAEDAAKQAEADVATAAKEAGAKAAELSRTRSDLGSVASLRTFWDFKDINRATLDLDSLRQHISEDALEKAVRSFVKAGGRELAGVEIFESTKTNVR